MGHWLKTRILIPFVPLAIDVLMRVLLLRSELKWWQIPDLKTFCITGAFFCLLIVVDTKNTKQMPTEEEYTNEFDSFVSSMMTYGIVLCIFFGITTAIEYASARAPSENFSASTNPVILIFSFAVFVHAVVSTIAAYNKFKLQFR